MARKHVAKQIKRWLIYVGACALVKGIRLVPRRAAIAITRGLARAAFYLIKSRRKRVFQHLTAAFGNEKSSKEINHMAKQVFLHLGTCGADAIRIPQIMGNGVGDPKSYRFGRRQSRHRKRMLVK